MLPKPTSPNLTTKRDLYEPHPDDPNQERYNTSKEALRTLSRKDTIPCAVSPQMQEYLNAHNQNF